MVLDGNNFFEAGFVCEVLSVVGFVGRELGVIYKKSCQQPAYRELG